MPTTFAVALALAVSLLLESAVRPCVSVRVRATMTLAVFFGVAYAARRLLLRLRDGDSG